MKFWETGIDTSVFDFEREKKSLLENLEYLNSMGVEEQTLYKKWVELQTPSSISSRSDFARYYDWQWAPTDIYDKELTIKEIENLDPYIEVVERGDQLVKWTSVRKMIHTMSWTANPGRNVKLFVIDRTSEKLLGLISLASDVTSIGVRDRYIGWGKEDKFENGKLNSTTIASTIVCTQPLGYNFLGGKLIAMMCTVPAVREHWKEKYDDILIGVTTTSLYGIHSQYNGIPHFKTVGETTGQTSQKPDDFIYKPWHDWLKENHHEEWEKAISATGPKQNVLNRIYSHIDLPSKQFHHGFKRGVYFAQMYDNGNDFLCSKIGEDELVMKKKIQDGIPYINNWWKRQSIKRYSKLHEQDRLKPDCLYYHDAVGISWEEMKKRYLKEVGR
jgi:hypothetical protein